MLRTWNLLDQSLLRPPTGNSFTWERQPMEHELYSFVLGLLKLCGALCGV
jgi:hypothetical protein